MKLIDLNCDTGETPEAITSGDQESLMPFITSVNIACGGHAGDAATMKETVEQAMRWKLAIGAHPGYPDRINFGRRKMKMPAAEIADSVHEQVQALAKIAKSCGASLTHVKPHGALYSQAVDDIVIAQAIADGVARFSRELILVGLASSNMLEVFRKAGFRVAGEGFADRRYEADGTLRLRKFDDAVMRDPAEAAKQVLQLVQSGTVIASDGTALWLDVQTICIHGDTPGARQILETIVQSLRKAKITVRALSRRTGSSRKKTP